MARNTKIQLRRGTADQWNVLINGGTDPVLAEGEIGYEIDTGRFKVGKTGGTQWSLLPYAGGSTIVSNTGIGFTFDQSANAYTLYSVITGINGGQDGISFSTFPLSDLVPSASGSGYRISLSSKLENFHDLNTNGIVVQSGSSFFGRSLSSGNNINITNANGVDGNPNISLSTTLTGINSITASGTNPLLSGFNINTSSGNFTTGLTVNNTGVVLVNRNINTGTGITGGGNLGSDLNLGLTGQAQKFHDLNTQGLVVRDSSNNIITRGLNAGTNIDITNSSGISANPSIALKPILTGIDYITATGTGTHSSFEYLDIDNLYIGQNIDISLTATVVARGPVLFEGNQFIVNGSGIFTSGLFVGPSGSPTGVSLSGHKHVYNDITDFCDGVSSCVDTSLAATSGIKLEYNAGTNALTASLTGQALELYKFNDTGLISRTGPNTFSGRTITASGSNIYIGNGDGVSASPTVGLNPNPIVQSLTTSGSLNVGANLTVDGNLTINGDTVITNVSIIEVEDPSIRIGGTSGTLAVGDLKDRGIEFVYQTGNSVPITGFFGYDLSANAFVFLNNVNATGSYAGTSSVLNVGGLYSTGGVSGTVLTSTTAQGTVSPIVVNSSGLVANLNSDYLDGQHGSHYLNAGNLTGSIPSAVLPVASTTQSGIAMFDSSNFIFNTNGIASTKNTVYTSGTQRVSGVKSFSDRLNLESGIVVSGITSIIAASSATTTTYFPVFTGTDPATTSQNIARRTLDNIRGDLGSTSNSTGILVLRDTINGGFTAGTITATGFIGYGGAITGINASNIASGTLSSGLLPDIATPFSTGTNSPTSIFFNGLTVDRAGRLLSGATGTFVNATDSIKGIASFASTDFDVSSGAVSIKTSGVGNTQLEFNSITIGSGTIALGGSTSTLSGLAGISGISASNPTTLSFCVIDGGSP